ncbi:hypothetical protein [Haloglomus halophilum]|uniref:hypothetical protein n=1 Tax=Haloglomus halophilum TaxID=2962672 RepID=UPI0020CA2668|nr:hypothetical protein [Haloglomus halophilum]
MPMKSSGAGSLNEVNRWGGGASWIPYPEEEMQRASHAVATDEGLVVVDPVDVPNLDEWLADLAADTGADGVAGVAVLLDRHKRDSAAVANRHDVPVGVPSWMSGVAGDLDAPTTDLADLLADTSYEVRRVIDNPFWQEAGMYDPDAEVLVLPEVFGTVDYYCAPSEQLGVHPMLRLTPPKKLKRLDLERLLVGHGEGITDDADDLIRTALRKATTNAPGLYISTVKNALF